MAADPAAILALIRELSADRWLAHRHLFARRHPDASPDAHRELVEHIHSIFPRVAVEGFRAFGKTTYVEEGVLLRACFKEFHNMVIVGSSYTRACDRIEAIKNEIQINELIHDIFGVDRASCRIWQEGKIVLHNGICIQALGREQSTAGIKHLDWRPDAAMIDDVEDPREVRTDSERAETWRWFLETFLPSMADSAYTWIRALGTRRGNGSLPERLEKEGWKTVKFPIEYVDGEGRRRATWPSAYPLEKIDVMRRPYRGDMHTWMQEYMCQASSEQDRIFARSMLKVVPRVRTWEAVYAMIDPARTTGRQSATTGWAAWSWVRNRLIVWGADGQRLLPDEIVALAFDINERFAPIEIGFEENGLHQWAMQPLRQEAVKRGVFLPVSPKLAPRGQEQFISGLQPFMAAGEVEFAQPLPILTDQLLSFPSGNRDAPNALAYALLMRPGLPVYESFAQEHITEAPEYDRSRPLSLVANATGALLAAALVQHAGDRLVVLADWMLEGRPAELAIRVWQEAAEAAEAIGQSRVRVERSWDGMLKQAMPDQYFYRRLPPVWVLPPRHADKWMNVGLLQAAKQIPAETRLGGAELAGRSRLSQMLSDRVRGMPVVEVAARATWTLRALAGGYARGMANGRLKDEPEPGPYRVLMEGLESFLGVTKVARDEDLEDIGVNVSYDRLGRAYKSAMPARRER